MAAAIRRCHSRNGAAIQTSVRLDEDNEPQPDACLRIVSGGLSPIDAEGYLAGPPELVVEIAVSSASYDLHDKLDLYRRSGVREYLVWRILEGDVDWFLLQGGQYEPLPPENARWKSRVFPGLWLDKPALLSGDSARPRGAP